MPGADTSPLPEEAFVLLCRSLASTTNRHEAERHYALFYKLIEKPLKRFIAVRSRYHRENTEDVYQDVMTKFTERLAMQGLFGTEIEARLSLVESPGDDRFLSKRVRSWVLEVGLAVTEAMRLPFLHATLTPTELLASAQASNHRLRLARDEGVRCLVRALDAANLTLESSRPERQGESPGEDPELGENAAETELGEQDESDAGLESGDVDAWLDDADPASAAQLTEYLDIKMRTVMAGDPSQRRALFLQAAPGLADADPHLVDFALDVGELVYMIARTRMPLLGLLYRMAGNLATDKARKNKKTVLLDDLLNVKASDGDSRALEEKELRLFGDGADQQYLNARTLELLFSVEQFLNRPWKDMRSRLREARTRSQRRKLWPALKKARTTGRFRFTVLCLHIQGYTQEGIAELLESTRDKIRAALAAVEAALNDRGSDTGITS